MRDILITLMVFGALPWILRRPHIGILVWSWLAYMNPHRMAWGFAYSMPFSALTALALFAGIFFSNEPKRIPVSPLVVIWIIFVCWMFVTTFFAFHSDLAVDHLERAFKIQLMTLLTLMLMNTRERINQLIWVIAISIGFFGVKGGIFTILTAGSYRVWGPPDTFIEGNNELAVALIMTIPLLKYLRYQATNTWIRWGLAGAMLLSGLSVIASYSRGAMLAGGSMLLFSMLKGKNKMVSVLVVLIIGLSLIPFIPDQWTSRMSTIKTYEEDGSAMGRINAWKYAINLAADRPIVGGGFGAFSEEMFRIYAPDPDFHQDAHSIYFMVLGHHGYPGLVMFMLIWILSYRLATKLILKTANKNDIAWASDLAKMLQVSLIGYLVGGAFLGLSYFDLPYHIMALLVLTDTVISGPVDSRPGQPGNQGLPEEMTVQRDYGMPARKTE